MKKIQRKSKQDGDKTSDKDSSKDDKGKYCSQIFDQFVKKITKTSQNANLINTNGNVLFRLPRQFE